MRTFECYDKMEIVGPARLLGFGIVNESERTGAIEIVCSRPEINPDFPIGHWLANLQGSITSSEFEPLKTYTFLVYYTFLNVCASEKSPLIIIAHGVKIIAYVEAI
jgi:hypothetical protein